MVGLFRLAALLACLALVTGCVTREGVSLGSQPYINGQFGKYAALPPGAVPAKTENGEDTVERSAIERVIVIGRTSAYREIGPDEVARQYEKYREQFKKA